MAIIYEIKERRLIPNWRDFKRTVQLGELAVSTKNNSSFIGNIERSLFDWNNEKSIGTAADLINSAFISDIVDHYSVSDAIKHIQSNPQMSSKSLLELAELVENRHTVRKQTNTILERNIDTIDEFKEIADSKVLFRLINKTKVKARSELYNPVVWIELARLYSMNGQVIQAENSITTALHLAPDNRFVLRSATRFYIHTEQFEKALFYLKKSSSLKHDPWLISAHIATSSIIKRFSPLIKQGQVIIDSKKFSDFELTELSSSLGTLEFNDGDFKKAKKFFNQSLKNPNDNSLAQMEWIAKHDNRFKIDPFEYNNVANPFEAYAIDLMEKSKWQEALENCFMWFIDMPYSKRPIIVGSYIASCVIEEHESAIVLCKFGLHANPHEPALLNNLIYALANSDRLEESIQYVKQLQEINIQELPDPVKITIQATIGLVNLKNGNLLDGKKFYETAIESAEKIKNTGLRDLALLNYTRELVLANQTLSSEMILKVKSIDTENSRSDIKNIKDKVLHLLFSRNLI